MYQTAAFVAEVLKKRYNGPTYERVGPGGRTFTYIPWQVSVRLLDEIFGAFGWSVSQPQVTVSGELVHVALALTVRVTDGPEGEVVEKTVPGVGSATLRDDNSAKSALSDALSKAVKYLGDAFGFYLSEKAEGAKNEEHTGNGAGNGAGSGGGLRPSAKQMAVLEKNGYTAEQVAGMDFRQWKTVLDAIFSGNTPPVNPAGKGRARAASDDLPC
jgi:hypothetical protein